MYNNIVATGVIVVDTSTLKEQVETEYKETFGNDLIVTPNTPQGVLITAEIAERSAAMRENATLANQINPNEAGGIFLDAIWGLTAGSRAKASFSTAIINVTGVAGTIIPAGSIVQNNEGDSFSSTGIITLDGTGAGSGTFQSLVVGPIGALANTLTNIIDGVLGWETATNPDDAIRGSLVQSDGSSKNLRRATVGAQGLSVAGSIIGAVNLLTRLSMSYLENFESIPQVIQGVSMIKNSIYCCVDGGIDQEVGETISYKKAPGCAYNNGASANPVEVTVVDPYSMQPTLVKFDRPDKKLILVSVTVLASTATTNPTDVIKSAVMNYANGEIAGEPGFAVGKNISPFEISGAINQVSPNLYIKNVQISFEDGTPSSNELILNIWEQGFTNNDSIGVVLV